MKPRYELGSEFHWMGLPERPFLPWPQRAVWYALGRHAVAALAMKLGARVRRRLWVPDFFCYGVARAWTTCIELVRYRDDPRWPAPDWESLHPDRTDLVLAVNFFGARDGAAWTDWRRAHPCLLVEDHTHDPASPWARTSSADYAFSSLRKTLPVPDGAVLWSPIGRALPGQPHSRDASGAGLKLAAMALKSAYLAGQGPQSPAGASALKARFRHLQLEGETRLEDGPIAAASTLARTWVAEGFPASTRHVRRDNASLLADALHGYTAAQPLNRLWPADAAPLGFVLVFAAAAARDRARESLRAAGTYCPVHWPAPPGAGKRLRELAGRLLTLPIDQRYGRADMERIAELMTGSTRRRVFRGTPLQ